MKARRMESGESIDISIRKIDINLNIYSFYRILLPISLFSSWYTHTHKKLVVPHAAMLVRMTSVESGDRIQQTDGKWPCEDFGDKNFKHSERLIRR